MTQSNWALANQNGFQNALGLGMQMGQMARQRQDQREQKNALAAYVQNPGQDTFTGVAQTDPERGLAIRQMEEQRAQQARQQQRDDTPVILNLLRSAKNNPQAYSSLVERARQMGIAGVDAAPPQFDSRWVDQQITVLEAFQTPQGREALSTAGKQAADEGLQPGTPEFASRVRELFNIGNVRTVPYEAGGGVARVDPVTGRVTPLIIPNPGNMPAGAAANEAPVQVQSIQDAMQLPPGTRFVDPNGVVRIVPGGAGGNASGNFPGR